MAAGGPRWRIRSAKLRREGARLQKVLSTDVVRNAAPVRRPWCAACLYRLQPARSSGLHKQLTLADLLARPKRTGGACVRE